MVTLYRLAKDGGGMWYNHYGEYQPHPKVKDVAMPYLHDVAEANAYCGVSSIEFLNHWFELILDDLFANGFRLYEIKVTHLFAQEKLQVFSTTKTSLK